MNGFVNSSWRGSTEEGSLCFVLAHASDTPGVGKRECNVGNSGFCRADLSPFHVGASLQAAVEPRDVPGKARQLLPAGRGHLSQYVHPVH